VTRCDFGHLSGFSGTTIQNTLALGGSTFVWKVKFLDVRGLGLLSTLFKLVMPNCHARKHSSILTPLLTHTTILLLAPCITTTVGDSESGFLAWPNVCDGHAHKNVL
jgi:hypothetical protein